MYFIFMRNSIHPANMVDNTQYKSNKIKTVIIAQTKDACSSIQI